MFKKFRLKNNDAVICNITIQTTSDSKESE